MSSFPFQPNTVLRYYPEGGRSYHYSGVVLKDGRVLQVKDPYKVRKSKKMFDSLVAWAESLPEFQDKRKERIRYMQIASKMFKVYVNNK